MIIPGEHALIVAATLLAIGLFGVIVRRNIVVVLMSIEIMLNAAALAFVAAGSARGADGQVMFLLILALRKSRSFENRLFFLYLVAYGAFRFVHEWVRETPVMFAGLTGYQWISLLMVVMVFMGFAVLPMGRNMVLVDMDAGLLFFFAMGASTELSVFMAGWSSRNKYSLLGAMRAVAQMISYEVPLLMSSVAVVMIAGSLSLTKIVDAQNHYTWGLPHWYIFTPWGLAGFLTFAVAATAETNRSPFDLPEGESELVAGYHTEYSGFKFALFFLGEYLAMFSISGLGTTLFLG